MVDVVIVGARCAGSSVAMLLARRGLEVVAFERDPIPSDMLMSTHIVHARGVACLGRWGLVDELVAAGCPSFSRWDLDFGEVTVSARGPAVDGERRSFAPRRLLLDGLLARAAVAAGADVRANHRVESVMIEDGRATGVRGVGPDGERFLERARLVVGADGPSSRVAIDVGAEEYATNPALQATGWIYWHDLPTDLLELHLRDYEAVYAFPTSGGATLVGINWAMDRFRAARHDLEASYFDILRRAAPALAERVAGASRAEPDLRVGSTRTFFRKVHGPGWVLLGDAHYKKDPCTGQGIADAFSDAEILAETIDRGLRGDADLTTLLDEYERSRVAWAMPFHELTTRMAHFAPLSPDELTLYRALRERPADAERFLGLVTTAVSPPEFFAPENLARILTLPA